MVSQDILKLKVSSPDTLVLESQKALFFFYRSFQALSLTSFQMSESFPGEIIRWRAPVLNDGQPDDKTGTLTQGAHHIYGAEVLFDDGLADGKA